MPVREYDVDNDEALEAGVYVWFRSAAANSPWRPGQILGTTQGLQDPDAQAAVSSYLASHPTSGSIDMRQMVLDQMESGGLRQRFWSYRIQAEDYPYEVVSISQRDLRPGDNAPAAYRLAVEQHGTLVKFGTGSLTTGIVDTFSFITGLQIVIDALASQSGAAKGKLALNIIAAIWALPVAAVGGRQMAIAVNDWSYRSKYQSVTMTATGALNLLSAAAGFMGSVATLKDTGDTAKLVAAIGGRTSVALWSVTQAIDLFTALKNIYAWYNDPLRDTKPVSPDVALAVKTLFTLPLGVSVASTSALPQAILIAATATASLGGSVAVHVAKRKVKQD